MEVADIVIVVVVPIFWFTLVYLITRKEVKWTSWMRAFFGPRNDPEEKEKETTREE